MLGRRGRLRESYLIPSWYLVSTNDATIPPEAERAMAARAGTHTIEVASSHVAMISHPDESIDLIVAAADLRRSCRGNAEFVLRSFREDQLPDVSAAREQLTRPTNVMSGSDEWPCLDGQQLHVISGYGRAAGTAARLGFRRRRLNSP
jgi:hypothetical protein